MSGISHSPVSLGARRYSAVLFALAEQESCVDSVEGILKSLAGIWAGSADFRRFMVSPLYNTAVQQRFIAAFVKKSGLGKAKGKEGAGESLVARFLGVLAQRGRLFLLPQIIASFAEQAAAMRGDVDVSVVSAEALSDKQQEEISALLADMAKADKRFGQYFTGKKIHLHMQVDPAVLGGFAVRSGSLLIDATLRKKLDSLKLALKEVH